MTRSATNPSAWRPAPSPLNGERAGVRGGHWTECSTASIASPASPFSPAEYSPDAPPAPANLPRSCRARIEHPSIASSRIAAFQCCAISNTLHAFCLRLVAQENRVARHPVPGCNAPQHKRNQGSAHRPYAVAGTCRRRSDGPGESPTASSRPKWTSCASDEQRSWDSRRTDLAKLPVQFKRCGLLSPLTLSLSPLRGEGIRRDDRSKFEIATCRRSAYTFRC